MFVGYFIDIAFASALVTDVRFEVIMQVFLGLLLCYGGELPCEVGWLGAVFVLLHLW